MLHCSALPGNLYLWCEDEGFNVPKQIDSFDLSDKGQLVLPVHVWLPEDGAWKQRQRLAVGLPAMAFFALSEAMQEDPQVPFGESYQYWKQVALFAMRMVASGAYLPTVTQSGLDYLAEWEPKLLQAHRTLWHKLADMMPNAARAVSTKPNVPPTGTRQELFRQMMAYFIDQLLRSQTFAGTAPAGGFWPSLWHSALTRTQSRLSGLPVNLHDLHDAVATWQQPLSLETEFSYQLRFYINEVLVNGVEMDPPQWMIEPRVVDLEEADGEAWPFLSFVEQPQEMVRGGKPAITCAWAALEHASKAIPVLGNVRIGRQPGIPIFAEQLLHFFHSSVPALEALGYMVPTPSWWGGKKQLSVSLQPNLTSAQTLPDASGKPVFNARVKLTWDTLLGDRPITLKELNERAKIKSSLQKINGQWVEVDTSSLRNALRFLKEAPSGELDSSRALRHLMGSHGVAPGVTVQQGRSSGWVTQLLDTLRQPGSLKDLPTPFHFHGQLRPYQLRGYSWLRFITSFGLGACLADDMGLGKTIQTLALLARLREEHTGQDRLPPTLLICPTSVMGNWEREVERFTPGTRVMLHHGPTRMKGEVLRAAAMQHDLVLTSFTLLTRDTEDLAEIPWLGIVVDEAQNIKNGETKQTRAARALPASFRIALTGTPVENHVGDLYSLMEFLNPGLLGTTREFQGRFLKPIQNFGNKEAALSLKRITSPFVLRRLKTDKSILSDLPEKFETKTYCKLTKEQGRLYQEIVAGGLQSLDGASAMQRRAHILTTIMRLKQVCDHPALVLRDEAGTAVALEGQSGKLERLTELLTEVRESGEKALVFSQFAEMGHLLQSYLEVTLKQKILFLHGGTPRLQREELIEEFSTPEGPGIFVLSLKAGGTGLNLVAANHVFHFDRWWNPAVENQATDRAFRIGQTKGVQVHKFICKGTLEERIDQMIEQKRELAEQVVQAGETWLTEMSTQELRNLFSLSQEAMED